MDDVTDEMSTCFFKRGQWVSGMVTWSAKNTRVSWGERGYFTVQVCQHQYGVFIISL